MKWDIYILLSSSSITAPRTLHDLPSTYIRGTLAFHTHTACSLIYINSICTNICIRRPTRSCFLSSSRNFRDMCKNMRMRVMGRVCRCVFGSLRSSTTAQPNLKPVTPVFFLLLVQKQKEKKESVQFHKRIPVQCEGIHTHHICASRNTVRSIKQNTKRRVLECITKY